MGLNQCLMHIAKVANRIARPSFLPRETYRGALPTRRSASRAKAEAITDDVRFDGLYLLRTNLPVEHLDTAGTERADTSLVQVVRAFRCIKPVDLEPRPVFHWTAPRARA